MKTIEGTIEGVLRLGSILLLATVLGCAGMGQGGDGSGGVQDDVVCRVDGAEIRRSDVETRKQRLLPTARYHRSVDSEEQQAMRRSALQSLIDEELQFRDARERGLVADPKKVEREYARLVERYGGRKTFEARLGRSGIKSKEIRAALEREYLIADVTQRVADSEKEAGEGETRAYFDEHAESFRMPRRAHVWEFLIYMPPLERDPEDWEQAIERANTLRSRVEAGESLADLAAEISEAPDGESARGREIGMVHPGQLEEPLDRAIWTLDAGQVSQPVRAFKGVYLVYVERFVEPHVLKFDEVEERLKSLLLKRRQAKALEDWAASLRGAAEIEIVDPALAPVDEPAAETR